MRTFADVPREWTDWAELDNGRLVNLTGKSPSDAVAAIRTATRESGGTLKNIIHVFRTAFPAVA